MMSMADAAGYLGSTIILLIKNFGTPDVSWVDFFMISAIVIGLAMAVFAIATFFFFKRLENKQILI
jgi:hypothetical protein